MTLRIPATRAVARHCAAIAALAICLTATPGRAYAADPGPRATATAEVSVPGSFDGNVGIALSPDRATAYVVNVGAKLGSLSAIDLATAALSWTSSVPMQAGTPVVSLDGTRILVQTTRGLTVVDPKGGQVLRTLAALRGASDPVIGPLGKHVYAADEERGRLLTLDARTLKTIRSTTFCPMDFAGVGPGPEDDAPIDTGVSVTPNGATVLVGCYMSGLQMFSGVSGKRLGAVAKVTDEGPAAFSPDGTRAYFAEGTSVSIVDLRTRSLVKRADIYRSDDGRKGAIADSWTPVITMDGSTLYIPWRANGTLKAVNTKTLQARNITLDGRASWGALQAALSPHGKYLYVLTPNDVVTIDPSTGTVIAVDRATPPGADATAMAIGGSTVGGSTVVVTWNATGDEPSRAGVSLLTMP